MKKVRLFDGWRPMYYELRFEDMIIESPTILLADAYLRNQGFTGIQYKGCKCIQPPIQQDLFNN